jgi:hypothetical protein
LEKQRIFSHLCSVIAIVLIGVSIAAACTVPVYRYALERWDQDLFPVYIFTKGNLDSSATAKVSEIVTKSSLIIDSAHIFKQAPQTGTANLIVVTVDVDKQLSGVEKIIWNMSKSHQAPWAVVRFPNSVHIAENIWEGTVSELPVGALINSPCRKQLEKMLLSGQSVVWAFIGSGDEKKDKAALKTLEAGLDSSRKTIKLPALEKEDIEQYYGGQNPGIHLEYSSIMINRANSAESLFIKILLQSEPLLKNAPGEPVTFPFFGRGRLLYGLAGQGITTANILEANTFLCGPCACTVKEQNPGKDLPFMTDWQKGIKEKLVHEKKKDSSLQGLDKFIGQSGK